MTDSSMPSMPRDVAIVSFRQQTASHDRRSESEQLLDVLDAVCADVGLRTGDVGFTCSGSTDYLAGQPFSFVAALDAAGPWPPIAESHVEMDAAWALYEAWLWLQSGDADTALVYGFGSTSRVDLPLTQSLQLDPYALAPLFPDNHAIAGLQARTLLEAGVTSELELAEITARSLRDGAGSAAAVRGDAAATAATILDQAADHAPLRASQLPPVTDGCAAVVLAAGDKARELTENPVWIRGIDHRIEAHALGLRDLAASPSTRTAAATAGRGDVDIDLAELHSRYPHEEALLRRELDLGDDVRINPSGGPMVADPFMATGLIRIGEVFTRLQAGEGRRALAHATSGPALQQNLVTVLEVR